MTNSVAPAIQEFLGDTTLIAKCADCQAELVCPSNGETTVELARNYLLHLMAGRIDERPFCEACIEANAPKHPLAYKE